MVLGAPLSSWVGGLIGAKSVVMTIWWAAQWPILAVFLLVAFTGILRSGPVAGFTNYGAAWGSLSAVIVMLTWLWLSGLAVLLGSEVELETARRHRRATPGTAPR